MFTADTDMQFRIDGSAKINGHLHQFADSGLIQLGKRIILKDLCIIICTQEFTCIITAETERHLCQVICTEAEEINFSRDFICGQRSSRNFNHGTDLVFKHSTGTCNFLICGLNNNLFHVFQFFDFTYQRNHNLGANIPVRMCFLDLNRSPDNRPGLHFGNFRIGYRKTAAAMSHHGVEFMQGRNDIFDCFNTLTLHFSEQTDFIITGGHKLMERRIQETNADRISLKRFVQFFKVTLLIRKDFIQSSFTFFNSIGADHFTECRNAFRLKEHMLCTAQPDTFGSQFPGLSGVFRSVGICSDTQLAIFISPCHNSAEFTGNLGINSGNQAVINPSSGAVNGNKISFFERLAGKNKLFVFFIHGNITASGNTAFTHAAGNNSRMACHAAAHSQNTLRALHACDVFR